MKPEVADRVLDVMRFLDDDFPGFVECDLVDASGRRHTFIEKVPIVSTDELDANSEYPVLGSIRGVVLARWRDSEERELVRLNTADLWNIESTEGLSEFVVLKAQVTPVNTT